MSVKQDSKEIIKYIKHNIKDMDMDEKHGILQILMNSSIDDSKLQTKGDGTQIKFCDIPDSVLTIVYNYIKNKIDIKKKELISL